MKKIFDRIKKVLRKLKFWNRINLEEECEYDLKTNNLALRDCTQIQLSYVMEMMSSQVIRDDKRLVLPIRDVKKNKYGSYIEIISTPVDHEEYTVSEVMIKEIPSINNRWAREFLKQNSWIDYYCKKESDMI